MLLGTLGGYIGYSLTVAGKSPLILMKASSNESPFDQVYREMARLGGLEVSAKECEGTAAPQTIVDREQQVIAEIENSSKEVNLTPLLSVARAIVAHRRAAIAKAHSDQQ